MNLHFDYYHKLENVDFYLCNPDGRQLYPLLPANKHLALRFNDLSELTFDVYPTATDFNGVVTELESYDEVRAHRLIYATDIGWFVIKSVEEIDNGISKSKSVTAASYQIIFQNKGIVSEERIYAIYNPEDPFDVNYDPAVESSVPSVVGQLYQQFGVEVELNTSGVETRYDNWTVSHISPSLISSPIYRTLSDRATNAYDWLINTVEEAFGVVVLFDFLNKSIQIKTVFDITEHSNTLLTFSNFISEMNVNEDASDVVTVLNCNGDKCDITDVNPTGTNYVCDFSYYKDPNGKWMSPALISALDGWDAEVESYRTTYESYITNLRATYLSRQSIADDLREASLRLMDIRNAINKKIVEQAKQEAGTTSDIDGLVISESVKSGSKSIDPNSRYKSTAITGSTTMTCYKERPVRDSSTGVWSFASGSHSRSSTTTNNVRDGYIYFLDAVPGTSAMSYGKLKQSAELVTVTIESTGAAGYNVNEPLFAVGSVKVDGELVSPSNYIYNATTFYIQFLTASSKPPSGATIEIQGSHEIFGGFDRYVWYQNSPRWETILSQYVNSRNALIAEQDSLIEYYNGQLKYIAQQTNILSYLKRQTGGTDLIRELECYWIEGDYSNTSFAVTDQTEQSDELDIERELMEAGKTELSKVSRPRFSFSVTSIDATKLFEFKEQMEDLELGKVVPVEKREGLWYYPALLAIEIDLDNAENFSMTFANALRLDDWGYTFADLVTTSAGVSNKVNSNWQNLIGYSIERNELFDLAKDPLSSTLRAAFANATNQEFVVDDTGITGRKLLSTGDGYEPEQVKLINNVLLFTDDSWDNAKAALGKITYLDPISGQPITKYGLIADTIIGNLVMSQAMHITNSMNSVTIDENGITIKNGTNVVFNADTSGNATFAGTISADQITSGTLSASYIDIPSVASSGGFITGGQVIQIINSSADALVIRGNRIVIDSNNFSVDANGTVTCRDINITGSSSMNGLDLHISGLIYDKDNLPEPEIRYDAGTEVYAYKLKMLANGKPKVYFKTQATGDTKMYVSTNYYYASQKEIWSLNKSLEEYAKEEFGLTTNPDLYAEYYPDDSSQLIGSLLITGNTTGTKGIVTLDRLNVSSKDLYLERKYYSGTAGTQVAVTATVNETHSGNTSTTITAKARTTTNVTEDTRVVIKVFSLRYADNHETVISGMKTNTFITMIPAGAHESNSMTATLTGYYKVEEYNATPNMITVESTSAHSEAISVHGDLIPDDTGIYNLGSSNNKWKNLYLSSSSITTSDRREKTDIDYDMSSYLNIFDSLRPASYKMLQGTSNRRHVGLIAQDVEQAIRMSGMTNQDYGLLVIGDADGSYALRYDELHGIEIAKIKALEKEIEELKEQIRELNN